MFTRIAEYSAKCKRRSEKCQLLTLNPLDVSEHYDHENTNVVNFVPPEKLQEIIDFTLPAEGVGLSPDLKCTFID